MKSYYSRDIFKQLQETMERLDKMESTLENTKTEHSIEIGQLNDKIDSLEKENAALKTENTRLKDDNERLRRIINNDSTNSSLPPSSDEKPCRAAKEYNSEVTYGDTVKALSVLLYSEGVVTPPPLAELLQFILIKSHKTLIFLMQCVILSAIITNAR